MNIDYEGNYHFETHFDMLVLTPAVAISSGECNNPECHTSHWLITMSWLFWTAEVNW